MHRDLKLENIVLDEKAKNGDITYPIKVKFNILVFIY